MRSLLVLALACCLLLAVAATGGAAARVGDADDVALAEIGVDLSHFTAASTEAGASAGSKATADSTSTYTEPAESYVTVRPLGHRDATIAKFPLLHELAGEEAKDWSDIQSLLFREPAVAAESNVDMKIDELEKKFNEIDAMPVPSPIPPPGSTLLPGIKPEKNSLRDALPENMMRLKQLKAKMEAKAAKKAMMAARAAGLPAAAAAAAAPAAPAAPAAAAPAAAAAVATPAAAPAAAAPAANATAAPAAPAAAAAAATPAAAAAAASPALSANAPATQATLTLIEKRIAGLTTLLQRLKSQMGVVALDKQASVARLNAALAKHRADSAELKKRMAARGLPRFAQQGDLDSEADHALLDTAAEAHADADAAVDADADADAEHESLALSGGALESDAEADAELNADAQALDDILQEIM